MIAPKTSVDVEFSNVQPIWRFCFLYIVTFGVYAIAWHHKQWKLIKDRGNLRIPPGAWVRGILFGLFMYILCRRISALAEDRGYKERFSAFSLTAFLWFSNFLGRLPSPFWFLTFFSVIPHIPVLKAVNYYWEQEQPGLPIRKNFTGREFVWLGFGGVLWVLVLIGLFAPVSGS
jgi:hypothetical protein